jgi:hypothetical protein
LHGRSRKHRIDVVSKKAVAPQLINRTYITSDLGKFKFPVYFTEEYLPSSTLETFKISENGNLLKDDLFDFISAKIYLGPELKFQLERSKKGGAPDFVTIDIKLIAS